MPHSATTVPDADALLCEGCGYVIGGLPDDSRCPECGKPLVESTINDGRKATLWESAFAGESAQAPHHDWARYWAVVIAWGFLATSAAVIFHPARFFRSTLTRSGEARSQQFARIHWMAAGVFYGVSADMHWRFFVGLGQAIPVRYFPLWIPLSVGAFVLLWWTTLLAARLSAWEAAYRGLRLPHRVVLRALQYHSAHYLPVALLVFATIAIYVQLCRWNPMLLIHSDIYLYTLCGEVVLSAAYLFSTYWIAMRNAMYANR